MGDSSMTLYDNYRGLMSCSLSVVLQLLPGLVHSYGGCQRNKETSDSKLAVCIMLRWGLRPACAHHLFPTLSVVYIVRLCVTSPI